MRPNILGELFSLLFYPREFLLLFDAPVGFKYPGVALEDGCGDSGIAWLFGWFEACPN